MIRQQVLSLAFVALALAACGKDSYITDSPGPEASVEFGDGVEILSPADTTIRLFADFTPITWQGRPAIPLQTLVGSDRVGEPELYGYRIVGTDGFYANMPGKGYGDNTWEQLRIGVLDLNEVRVLFETERDPNLRKGHNVKYVIRVELLRSIDVDWGERRKLAPLAELETVALPEAYEGAGAEAVCLASAVEYALPGDLDPADYQYRVQALDGSSLPRLLTWPELASAYHVLAVDAVVLPASLGPAYRLSSPKRIRLEGGGR